MSVKRKIAGVIAGMTLIGLLAGCSASADKTTPADGTDKPIKIGVVNESEAYWKDYVEAAKKEGINVEIVGFAEYPLPNPALQAGDIDLNQFQHIIYLAQHDAATGDDLVPVGSTAIFPLSLYSNKYKTPEEIPADSKIAIPNDESNQARALLVLQSAGLVKLKDGGSTISTPEDVLPESKVEVTAVDGALAPTLLDDPAVAGAVINNDWATKAGIDIQSAIAKDSAEDPKSQAYVNIFAARGADKDNPTFKKLVEIYQNDQKVLDGVQKTNNNTAVFAKIPAADLQKTLEDQIKLIKDNK
ncbi:MetQ/NlpA family ABC transporter substrate-binding protein [Mycetocola spongiae]|uniref:MetQ/NlpA family ABC transporter substrate-binding protein n=1 Tax=Mycetocola spongiae TaxID=2859226 RepID=UPI001CF38F95|nr:MetQ/NlpA family ABC transporter substrate-binding protein [Mycetocola spongiae]UCR88931.1 methionine ABC transporter substrate-binding protein [Mycetocola spongiae]